MASDSWGCSLIIKSTWWSQYTPIPNFCSLRHSPHLKTRFCSELFSFFKIAIDSSNSLREDASYDGQPTVNISALKYWPVLMIDDQEVDSRPSQVSPSFQTLENTGWSYNVVKIPCYNLTESDFRMLWLISNETQMFYSTHCIFAFL